MMRKAIRIHCYGGPDVMRLEELPVPVPGPAQALVRVCAASVNFLDIQKRRGELVGQAFYQRAAGDEPEFPAILGSQGVGVVEAIGPEVSNVRIGDRVAFWGHSYTTHTVLASARLIAIPDALSFERAAAGMNQGFLAYAFTHFAYPIHPGDWCLIQAAAGGIGLLLCQMAKIHGGRVVGVTSTEEKAKFVREAGADKVIISNQADVAKQARRLTQGRGVSVVYDGVGKDTFEASLNSLAPAGYFIIFQRVRASLRFDDTPGKRLAVSYAHEWPPLCERVSALSQAACSLDRARKTFHQNRSHVSAGRRRTSPYRVRRTTLLLP
jgi:NADPH2:quinone reductase